MSSKMYATEQKIPNKIRNSSLLRTQEDKTIRLSPPRPVKAGSRNELFSKKTEVINSRHIKFDPPEVYSQPLTINTTAF